MSDRNLKIKFAGRLIDLLGQQMYGGAVPSVAELVANAWDADAKRVEITIPDNIQATGAEIIVQDFGHGMTFQELNDYYLHIGYERRERGEKTAAGRNVMGRKGIGKLAGFGIAEDIVLKSVKENHLVQFTLNYTELRKLQFVGNWEFEPDKDEHSDEPNGVTVIFKKLKLKRSIIADAFRTSMARRFAISSDEMAIAVNGIEITKEDIPIEYRYPEATVGWQEEEIDGFGKIKYWFGFQKTTINDPELQGVTIFARKRIAQGTPFFFNLTGGFNGQVHKEYLTGQIIADTLDDDTDYIATDRQTVNWQFGKAPIFETWGKSKIKWLCADVGKKRKQKKIDKFKHKLGDYFLRIDKLSSQQERKDITSALERIATIDSIEEEDFKVIASSMVSGYERESVKKVIQRINSASDDALPELFAAIKEWDVISAVSTSELILGKIEIIKKFQKHINDRVPEKTKKGDLDMQDFIKDYPWLIGHQYENLNPADFHHEHGVDKWIKDSLLEVDNEKPWKENDKKEKRRFDLLCLRNDGMIVILELMRPGIPADYDHLMRLNRYVTKVSSAAKSKSTAKEFEGSSVYGILIADDYDKDTSLMENILDLKHKIDVYKWNSLFELVEARYKDFLEILKQKAPEDPRIKGLVHSD